MSSVSIRYPQFLACCQSLTVDEDVGHGSGDSLLLQLTHPATPRPKRLVGITSLASHHHRAFQRLQDTQIRNATARDIEVELYLGNAVYHASATSTSKHPLHPDGGEYSTILALDCAYHFDTRHDFLSQSFEHLSRGGKIALADICFSNVPSPLVRYALGLLGVMPTANIMTGQEYRRAMEKIGYIDVTLVDISDDVFPGFMHFLSKRGLLWKLFVGLFGMLVKGGARYVLVTGQKP